MFNGINGDFGDKIIGGITNVNGVKNSEAADNKKSTTGTFGYGFSTGSGTFVRNIVPDTLLAKFDNVNPPKYDKNIPQLTIDDKYYIPDKPFEEEGAFCEV